MCLIYMIVSYILLGYLGANRDRMFIKGLPNASISGVVCVFIIVAAVGLVCIDRKKGTWIALICLYFQAMGSLMQVVRKGNNSALPGVFMLAGGMALVVLVSSRLYIIYKASNYDHLTGIRNRRLLQEDLTEAFLKKKQFYFVYMDLNEFKKVNDFYGHDVGDTVLVETTKKWKKLLNEGEKLYRFSGDEFCLKIPKSNTADIENYIKPFITDIALEKFIVSSGESYDFVKANAGIVEVPEKAKNKEDLLRLADFALQHAKSVHDKNCCVFDAAIEEEIDKITKTEALVKKGLDEELFYMVYQPQFDAKTKKLRGFESLIRLRDDDGKVVSPGTFIPVMERTGTILKIDYYVLRKTISDFLPIIKENPELTVSVNISAQHITDLYFADAVEKILYETDFPAKNLEIEITEYSFVYSTDVAVASLDKFKKMGCQIALDDFGTGYSSLSMISTLPLNLIKIDKSLVDNIHLELDAMKMVGQIIAIGQTLRCEVIAEGIELDSQREILANQGCDYIQGFLWGRPMEYSDVVVKLPQMLAERL